MTFEVKEIFEYKGRRCVILYCDTILNHELGRFAMTIDAHGSGYHNGYVSLLPESGKLGYNDYIEDFHADELTFSGRLKWSKHIPDLWYFGFDSAHAWNDRNSSSFDAVKHRTIALADEMIEAGI